VYFLALIRGMSWEARKKILIIRNEYTVDSDSIMLWDVKSR
jgi:hypothetical protein